MNVTIDGCSIYWKVSGAGDEVALILQGWGTSCALYDSIAAMLGETHRVVQLDLPGFGASDEPSEPWDADRYARFLDAFAEELGIEHCVLLAHSFGGRVALKLISNDASRLVVDRLVLIDSAGIVRQRTPEEERRIKLFKMLRRITEIPLIAASFPDLIQAWREKQGSEDYRNSSDLMKRTMVMSISEDLTPLMPQVGCPTLLVWGADDDATPLSDADRMKVLIPDARLVVIEGAGHFPFLDQPLGFWDALGPFVGEEA